MNINIENDVRKIKNKKYYKVFKKLYMANKQKKTIFQEQYNKII